MSYDYSYGTSMSVADSTADVRAAFIRRTYAHLAGAILAFVAIEYALLNFVPNIGDIIMSMFGNRMMLFVMMAAFIGTSYVAQLWAQSSTSVGMQYAGLSLYVVLQAVIILPMLYVANQMADKTIIPTAGVLTLATFGGLTAAVMVTGKDFSFLGPVIAVGSMIALGVIIAGLLFGFSLGLFFSFAMVALASACILYQTSNVMREYNPTQHVAAALALFAAVALLFFYILRIVMASRE